VVDKALAPAAADRHADAAAVAGELSALLARFPEEDCGWGGGGHVPLSATRPRHSRWLVPALGVVGMSLVAGPWITIHRTGEPAVDRERLPSPIESITAAPRSELPLFRNSPIEKADFRHAVRDVDDPEADRYLIESTGMRKWHEEFGQRFFYWGPDAVGVEGRLVFRYDFPRPSRRIHLRAGISCVGQRLEVGVIGNGACALEFSRDGHDWRPVVNYLEPRIWGQGMLHDGLLPDEACGGTSLWLRIRLLAEGPWKGVDYSVAQFLRKVQGDPETLFELEAECEPAVDAADTSD
jgi:hypothetical protein